MPDDGKSYQPENVNGVYTTIAFGGVIVFIEQDGSQ
jgi:hypothetical protein